jgi:hypothetical protein
MVDDIAKSVRLILHERITSPLSGAIIFSWFVWNWRLIYFLISPGENLAFEVRMKVIETNYLNLEHNLYYPLWSALFLVGVYPFFTTIALAGWLWFKRLQNRIRQKIERSEVVTLDQWRSLRDEIDNQEKKFNRALSSKDNETAALQKNFEAINREILARDAKINDLEKQLAGAKQEGKSWEDEIAKAQREQGITAGADALPAKEIDKYAYVLQRAFPSLYEFMDLGFAPRHKDDGWRLLKSLSQKYKAMEGVTDAELSILNRLRRAGFIGIKKLPTRGIWAKLTPKGRDLVEGYRLLGRPEKAA